MGAEGFGKRRLFEIMDDLEARTRPIMVAARCVRAGAGVGVGVGACVNVNR